ncbi:hypothetical protein HKD37_18G051210 [Glycine soja]
MKIFSLYQVTKSHNLLYIGQSQYESEKIKEGCVPTSLLEWENVVICFCSLHNRPDNYLKEIINRSVLFFNTFALALVGNINILIVQYASMFVLNSALKGLNDTPQSKSKVDVRWIVVKYFNDVRPLKSERLKALRIQWATYYLKVKNEIIRI